MKTSSGERLMAIYIGGQNSVRAYMTASIYDEISIQSVSICQTAR
jgi:hypothetical protein